MKRNRKKTLIFAAQIAYIVFAMMVTAWCSVGGMFAISDPKFVPQGRIMLLVALVAFVSALLVWRAAVRTRPIVQPPVQP